ncbi:MAG: hypothetical protein GVY28_07305 [Alphaproteobacteria bacterium]|jgi:hypothetical protein|nr:hypothetical protein [Alphaproteobacteria bacterium]
MPGENIYADGIAAVQLTNGNLRIDLVHRGAEEGQAMPAGTLIIPAVRARTVLGALNQSLRRIEEQMRQKREARQAQDSAATEN